MSRFCSFHRAISCLHVDFECFKLAPWPALIQNFMNFWNFLTCPVSNSDDLILHVLKAIASLKSRALITKLNRSSYVQVTTISVYSKCALDVQSQSWHLKVLDLAPFRGSYVREFESSHSNLVNRFIKITHAHNLHVKMLDFALSQFVRKLFTRLRPSRPIVELFMRRIKL